MTRKKILAANWKMNMSLFEMHGYFERFLPECNKNGGFDKSAISVEFAMPYTFLLRAKELVAGSGIEIMAQNCHQEESGAFTGEISARMLAEIGISRTLIGHSERRQLFGEKISDTEEKIRRLCKHRQTFVFCVGETKEERERNLTDKIVLDQLEPLLALDEIALEGCAIAYEPVWAIGTGLTATSEQAENVHAMIRGELKSRLGVSFSEQMPILYGGSVKPSNFAELLSMPNVDGGLVGGASLKVDDFLALLNIIKQ